MGLVGDIIGGITGAVDIIGGITGAVDTGYNIWANKRDFDYQKALQQKMFEREDTAVQRRAADLEAAGLNPALAGGSAASAGPVVSRSNTNDVDFGSALDMMQAVNSIALDKQETQNAKKEGEILESERGISAMKELQARINLLNNLGIDYAIKYSVGKDGRPLFTTGSGDDVWHWKEDMPFYKLFDYQLQNQKNAADLLQKDVDFYAADKLFNYVTPFIPRLGMSYINKR